MAFYFAHVLGNRQHVEHKNNNSESHPSYLFDSKPFAQAYLFIFVAGAPVTRAVSQPSERERKDSVRSVSEMSENGSQVFLRLLGSAKTS